MNNSSETRMMREKTRLGRRFNNKLKMSGRPI